MATVRFLRVVKSYRVTIQLVQNLRLTSKQKFRFGLAFVLKSTGGFAQAEWSPCINTLKCISFCNMLRESLLFVFSVRFRRAS